MILIALAEATLSMNFRTKLESLVPNVPLGKDFATKICAVSIFKPVL